MYSIFFLHFFRVFGFSGEEAKNVIYVNWLSMVHKGIESLKMYNSSVNKWLQAHSQARYVITRVLLESSKELVNIKYIEESPIDGMFGSKVLLINLISSYK
jgi:dipeptidyl-peptidase-3